MKPNVNDEINSTYEDAKIKDNSIEFIYSTKPVKFNNNPYIQLKLFISISCVNFLILYNIKL